MNEITWKYEKRDIDDLIENKDNPRRISKKKVAELKKSLGKFGVCQPIVTQPTGEIIGGHQRLKTLRSIGIQKVDVAIPSRVLSKREYEELSISLNKISGEFNLDMLANRWDMDVLLNSGFSKDELFSDVDPQEKPKKFTISLKFDNEEDLRHIESQINTILYDFPEVLMNVKVK